MADHVGIHGSDHDITDNTGPHCSEFRHLRGTEDCGIPGAVVATVGCILPSCIIVTILARLYLKYRNLDLLQGVLKSLRPAVVAMIASAGILILKNAFWGSAESISLTGTEWSMVLIFGICVLLLRKTKLNPHLGHGAGGCHEGGNLRNDKCFVM